MQIAPATTPPRLLNPETMVSSQDYPEYFSLRDQSGNVTIELSISADGRVVDCAVTETSKIAMLDTITCANAKKYARFEPSRNADGDKIASSYRTRVIWSARERPVVPDFDLSLYVKALPRGYAQPASLRLTFGPDGHVMQCYLASTSGNAKGDVVACREATRQLVIPKPSSGSGREAIAIRSARVSFKVKD